MFYTRAGDNGDTGLFGSTKRMPKYDARIEALGAVDELNSLLGICKIKAPAAIARLLEEMQQNLFIAQAELGGAEKRIAEEKIKALERLIDAIEKKLPPLRNFVVSGGTELAAFLDYTRAVARRAERRVVAACAVTPISPTTRVYLNRLSSALFALARFVNARGSKKEKHPRY